MRRILPYLVGKRLVTTVLFAASLTLSLASAVTTYLGMSDYSGFILVAAGVTFGVQCLLFAISWWIGQNWRRGWRHILGGGLIFATCAFVSIFFSFASLYTTIDNGRSDSAAQQRMEDRVSELEKELARKLENRVLEGGREVVLSDASVAWQSNVREVLEIARAAPEKLRQKALAERDAAQQTLIEEQRKLRSINDQIAFNAQTANTLQSRLTEAEERAAAAKDRRVAAEDAVRDLKSQIASEKARRDAEEADGGCGRECQAIERQIKNLERDLIGLNAAVEQALRLEQEEQDKLKLVSQPNGISNDLQSLEEQKALLEIRISDIETLLGSVDEQLQDSVGDSIALVRSQLADFNELDFSKFSETVASCTWLREQLTAAGELNSTSQIDCSGSELVPALASVQSLRARLVSFADRCDTSSLFLDKKSFAELRTFGDVCISEAGFLDDDTRAVKNELFRMEQSRGAGAHNFAKVQASLLEDNDPLAQFALALAFAIDILVLLCALIGTNVGTSEHVRALQYVLLHKRPDPLNPGNEILLQPESRADKALFDKASDWLSARSIASFTFDEDDARRGLEIKPDALKSIQAELFKEASGSSEGAAVPTVTKRPQTSATSGRSERTSRRGRNVG